MEHLEYEITEFCVKQKQGIEEHIAALKEKACDNPILRTFMKEALLEEIRQFVAKEMNKSYLDVSTIIDTRFIDKWLSP